MAVWTQVTPSEGLAMRTQVQWSGAELQECQHSSIHFQRGNWPDDPQSAEQQKSFWEKFPAPQRGLGERPGWVHAPALQLPTAGRKMGERRSAALLMCHTWSTQLSLQPRVTLCVKHHQPVGNCVFSFWSHTVSEHRYCTTVHKSVFKKLLKGILFQCASLPHSY